MTNTQTPHDFETPIELTSISLAKFIINKLNENADDLIFHKKTLVAPFPPREPLAPVPQDTTHFTPEEIEISDRLYDANMKDYGEAKAKFEEEMAAYDIKKSEYDADVAEEKRRMEVGMDISIDIFKEISKSDITIPYATRCIDKIQIVLGSIQKYIDGSISQQRHEYASRSLAVKAPDSGKYTEECSTVGHLALKLQEVRDSQGNKKSDYFFGVDDEVETTDLSTEN